MKLRNGADEEKAVVAPVVSALRDLKEDYGHVSLLVALRVANGATATAATRSMLDTYGLTRQGIMSQTARNVIQSAVTAKGELVSPYEQGKGK